MLMRVFEDFEIEKICNFFGKKPKICITENYIYS